MKNFFAKPEEELITQGTNGECMYFLAKGDCEVFVIDEFRKQKYHDLMRSGRHFGEIALLYNTLRTATIRARNYSTIS